MGKYQAIIEWIKIKPSHFILILSGLIAAVAGWESRTVFLQSPKTISEPRVLVAAHDLEQGDLVTFADLKTKPLGSLSLSSDARFFTDQDLPMVQGKRLLGNVSMGMPLLFNVLYQTENRANTSLIPKGMRAYFIETETLDWVRPGGYVDLILKPIAESKSSLILVESALVLAAGSRNSESGVVVALKPEEIEWIEKNTRFGKIVLAVRNPNESSRYGALKKDKQRSKKRVKVEVISEGS